MRVCVSESCSCDWWLPRKKEKTQSFQFDWDRLQQFSVSSIYETLFWPRTQCSRYPSSNILGGDELRRASSFFRGLGFCEHHPLSITFHNSEDRAAPLPTREKNIFPPPPPRRLIMFWNWFLWKHWKADPLKQSRAFVVVWCTIHNELYCEGHDKWIFLCLLWPAFGDVEILKRPLN